MSIAIGGFELGYANYDSPDEPVDVLYLRIGEHGSDRDWDETAEGDGVGYAANGSLNGFTVLNPLARLERDGQLEFTLPEQQVVAVGLDEVLAARAA